MNGRQPRHNWDDLRHFLAVARTGTLSAAADATATDHTTVARRIGRLEETLGAKMFFRSNAGYTLTGAGEQLLPLAEAMEAGYIAAAALERAHLGVSGLVRIGTPDGFGTYFLAPLMPELAARHPGLEIELLATARLFSLSKREADIVISLTSPEHGRVVSRRLTDYHLQLYAAPAYLAARAKIVSMGDLQGQDFIGYIEDMLFTPELNYLSALGKGINPRIRSTNLITQLHAALAGGGICVLPVFLARAHAGLAPVLPGEIRLTRSFYMHIHEDNRKAAQVRAAAAFISEKVAESSVFLDGASQRG
jgi:DNA-binding transcriptional LysR family regulator